MEPQFTLDKPNRKVLGVCSGLARSIGYDPLFIRALAVLALVLLGPVTILAYLLTGWLAD